MKNHIHRYHEWMKCPTLRYLTGSDALTLAEEYEMQKRWLEDKDSKYLSHALILIISLMQK